MAPLTLDQWDEVRRLYVENCETLDAIAKRFGIGRRTIQSRARAQGWPRRRRAGGGPRDMAAVEIETRRTLVHRLRKAIDAKLTLMELRMQNDMKKAGKGKHVSSADHERDARAIGTLVRNFDKLTEIASDLEHSANGKPASGDAAALFAEADRYRRELAERLAKFLPAAGRDPK
jgi:hypothetical protein